MSASPVTLPSPRQVPNQLRRGVVLCATLLPCAALAGCGGCVPPGNAATDAAPTTPILEDLDVHEPSLGVSRFRSIDFGDFSMSVPDSWIREDVDAGWSVVGFDAPGKVGGRLQVLLHPVGESWDVMVAGLVDGGWTAGDASDSQPAIFHGQVPGVAHEVVRILPNGRFVVAIHCQYFEDGARPSCNEQLERLELDVRGRDAVASESHGFRFVGATGWHPVIEPPSDEVFETDGYPRARVLVIGASAPPAKATEAAAAYQASLAGKPEVSVKAQRPVVYRGRTGTELELDVATFAPQTLRVTQLELPSGQAIVSCQGPSTPELDRVCEASMRSVVFPSTDPAHRQ
jgi:hypothetical protein